MFGQSKKPILNWSTLSLQLVFINRLELPSDQRGQGKGRALYQDFEASLPPNVKSIELYTAQEGAFQFWTKMGFSSKDGQGFSEEGVIMVKHLK